MVGASVLLCASVLAMVFSGGNEIGSIRILSSPVTDVEVWLDGESIGNGTPLVYEGLSAGMHKIRVKAKGFSDKAYLFEAPGGSLAEIEIELDPLPDQAPPALGVLQVVSDPAGATVRVNNEVHGETPITIGKLDRNVPMVLHIEKEGFAVERRTERFESGEEKRVVTITLTEATKQPELVLNSTVRVITEPPGAIVWLDGHKKGVSPITIQGVARGEPHRLEAYLKGYRKQSKRITLKDSPTFDWMVELVEVTETPKIASSSNSTSKQPKRSADRACGGSGGKLSVMPVGVADCTVTVGTTNLGVAPFFKKSAPKGNCQIVVTCPDGRKKTVTKRLGGGGDARVIIKPGDW
jgi:hypothetical protein